MPSLRAVAEALAATILAGPMDEESLVERSTRLFGRRWRWLRPLARRLQGAYGDRPRPSMLAVTDFLLADRGFRSASERHELVLSDQLHARLAGMLPSEVAEVWNVRPIDGVRELASWLGLSVRQLEWLADPKGFERKRSGERLRNYRYRLLAKKRGSVRLVESPKPRLKQSQRQICEEILSHIPPDEAVHGFCRGRSIKTFASPHMGQAIVLKMDLRDFFPSIRAARVRAVFRFAGYPDAVAGILAGLCTNAAPQSVWDSPEIPRSGAGLDQLVRLYSCPHLPQGAPTSPTLANLCAYRMDRRLSRLAEAAQATYTRYADDLAFSGGLDFARSAKRFLTHAAAVAIEEGFQVNHRKTRIMRRGTGQRLVGLVLSENLGTPRDARDQLKATLHNCVRHGPASQDHDHHTDYRGHLKGRVAFVEMINPKQGRRLRELFERIVWE